MMKAILSAIGLILCLIAIVFLMVLTLWMAITHSFFWIIPWFAMAYLAGTLLYELGDL